MIILKKTLRSRMSILMSKFVDDYRIYKNVYTIDLPKGLTYAEVIEELSTYKNITNLHLVSLST